MSNNLTFLPEQPTTVVRPDFTAAIYIAPRRFDVHAVAGFLRWADEALARRRDLVLDLRMVDFMDVHMKTTLDQVADRATAAGVQLVVRELSPAAALTFDLLDRAAA